MTTYVDRIHHGGSGILVEEASNNGTITFLTKESGTPSEKFRITSTGVLVSADLAMGGNKITGLGAPTASTDVATKGYIDTEISTVNTSIGAALPLTGGTMAGAIAMGTNKITGLGTPSATGDAATKGYVDTEVANLVDSSPSALNTLNELAAAINDDENFSTTVTNSIAGKLPLSGGQMTGNITFSGSQTVDGRDLSADGAVIDGLATVATSGSYNDLTNTPTPYSDSSVDAHLNQSTANADQVLVWDGSDYDWSNVQADQALVSADTSRSTASYPVWTTSASGNSDQSLYNSNTIKFYPNSGTIEATTFSGALNGNAMNADTVDSLHASSFLRSDTHAGNSIFRVAAGDGNGIRFWNGASAYSIYMSASGDATYGGRLDSTSDYNIYFDIANGTNRGFVFMNNNTPKFQIESTGQFRSVGGGIIGGQLSMTAPIEFDGTLDTYDAPGSPGSDTATDVAIAMDSGHRIVGHNTGYIRTLLEWNTSSDIQIGQGNTSMIGGIDLLPGSSGLAKVNGSEITTNKQFLGATNDGTTGAWHITDSNVTAYTDNMCVALFTNNIAGVSTGTTLEINSLGAKGIYYQGDSVLTTHYGPEALVMLIYTAADDRWYAHDFYYTSDDYRMRWQNDMTAGSLITGYQLLMEGIDGKMYPVTTPSASTTGNTKPVQTAELKVNGLMLHYESSTDYAADATITANSIYSSIFISTMEYWHNYNAGWATAYRPWYIVCTKNSNGNFVLDNSSLTSFLTQTLPTSDDGKYYIMGGWMHDTWDAYRLQIDHPIYVYKDGEVRLYAGYAESSGSGGGGATGASNDKIFFENGTTVTTSYTIGTTFGNVNACNAMTAGPVTVNSGVVITVNSGSAWTVV